MKKLLVALTTALCGPALSGCHHGEPPPLPITGADSRSAYLETSADVMVAGASQTLLMTTVDLAAPDWVLVASDGRFSPIGAAIAEVHITIDGTPVSNRATIDWSQSSDPVEHSYEAVGAQHLSAGSHGIALVATPLRAQFNVGAGANLSVMVHPASSVTSAAFAGKTDPINFDTINLPLGQPAPMDTLVTANVTVPGDLAGTGPLIALASGGAFRAGHDGDAMFGIFLDGADPGLDQQLWTVNDVCSCAETNAPLYTHAFLRNLAAGAHAVTLAVGEFPWNQFPTMPRENPAIFAAGDDATLVTLGGGLTVAGSYFTNHDRNQYFDYFPIGTSEGWMNTPNVGTDVKLADSSFDVPAGHTGVVMFMTKTRVQGDASDPGGTVKLWLELDGQRVGSLGLQQLAMPFSVSQRTLSASYLAAGSRALKPGPHTIRAFARVDGQFIHLVVPRDLPLIWFD
jgi:hypothetical protein